MIEAAVFNCISSTLASRAFALEVITRTGYSFEDWCLWELIVALQQSGLSTKPKPSYTLLGAEHSKQIGDILIESEGRTTLVEIAVAHDWTADKWIEKIQGDFEKLRQFQSSIHTGMVVLIGATTKCAEADHSRWWTWLEKHGARLPEPELIHSFRFPGAGNCIVYGWIIRPPS